MKDFWTPEREVELTRLWTVEQWSAGKISQHFGGAVSRSAVCAKVARIIGSVRGNVGRSATTVRKERPKPVLVKAEPVVTEAPVGPTVHLEELGARQCHFPMWGDHESPTLQYCGAAASDGEQWCPYHRRIVFQPVTNRGSARAANAPALKRAS